MTFAGAAGLSVVGLIVVAIAEHMNKKAAAHPATPQAQPVTPQPLPAPSPTPQPTPASPNPFLVGPDGKTIFQNDPNVGDPNLPATGVEAAAPGNAGAFTPEDMAAMSGGGSNIQESEGAGFTQGTTGFNPFRRPMAAHALANPFARWAPAR